jgi:hypothetical protein
VCLKIAIFPPTKSCRFIGTFSWLTMGDGWLKNMFDVQIISNPSFFTMNTIHMYIIYIYIICIHKYMYLLMSQLLGYPCL